MSLHFSILATGRLIIFLSFFLLVGHLDIDFSIILFTRDLDAVVEITALLGVILLQLSLTTVPAPQTKNL